MAMKLYGYFRSSAAFRVRIALNLKKLNYEAAAIHLRRNDQTKPDYLAVNPQGLVPTLDDGGRTLIQSLAIIEYLDDTYPDPPLLPSHPVDRARVRALAEIVACDIPSGQQSAGSALSDAFAGPRRDRDRNLVQSLDRCRLSGLRAAACGRSPDRRVLPWQQARYCRHRSGTSGGQCRAVPARSRSLSDDRSDPPELHGARSLCCRASGPSTRSRGVSSLFVRRADRSYC